MTIPIRWLATTICSSNLLFGPLCLCHSSQCVAMPCSRKCLVLLTLALTSRAEDAAGHLRGPSKEDAPATPSAPADHGLTELVRLIELPDASGLPDTPGPYKEVPSDADAGKPTAAVKEWRSKVPNATHGSLGSLVSLQAWQDYQFCNVHQTGFFCDGLTRIRCCKLENGYAKCGSAANSSTCGAEKPEKSEQPKQPEPSKQKALWFYPPAGYPAYPGYPGGSGGWHIHQGWHVSSYCQSHHVGSFCRSHSIIHCCNDFGHYVECNSAFSDSGRWC